MYVVGVIVMPTGLLVERDAIADLIGCAITSEDPGDEIGDRRRRRRAHDEAEQRAGGEDPGREAPEDPGELAQRQRDPDREDDHEHEPAHHDLEARLGGARDTVLGERSATCFARANTSRSTDECHGDGHDEVIAAEISAPFSSRSRTPRRARYPVGPFLDNGSMMPRTRAILLDALQHLVELEPPMSAPRRCARRRRAAGRAAVRAEMRYYRAHSDEGRDAGSLADPASRCANVLSRNGRTVDVETLMAAIRFRAFPDAAVPRSPAGAAPDAGLRLEQDYARGPRRSGSRGALDAVVTSAAAGARKPDPSIFVRALELAGTTAGEAVHVGDTAAEDVEGARRRDPRAAARARRSRRPR